MTGKLAQWAGLGLLTALFVWPTLFVDPALSQENMTHVLTTAFGDKQRPPSIFVHDEHNVLAKIEDDCWRCHHYDGKNPDPMDHSAGIPCVDCHPVEAEPDVTPLMQAYHKQCKDCHLEKKSGPIACGECHVRP